MKKKSILNRIAAILAFVIGAMAIFAGGQVILGILPDYYIIDWLPIYNFVIGIASVIFTSVVIWKNTRLALPAAITTFSLNAIVMTLLLTIYGEIVALDSIIAMLVRLTVWMIIIILLKVHHKKITEQGDS